MEYTADLYCDATDQTLVHHTFTIYMQLGCIRGMRLLEYMHVVCTIAVFL